MKRISFILILLSGYYSLYSQGGSNYSANGIGEIENFYNAQYAGMAGTSIAMPLANGININNPAMWSYNQTTKMQLGYKFNQNLISNNDLSVAQFNSKLDGLQLMMVIDTSYGFSIGMGLYSYSNIDFKYSKPEFAKVDDDFTATGKTIKTGDGGIATGYFGFSIEPMENLSIGLTANINFGRIFVSSESIFEERNAFDQLATFEDRVLGDFYKIGLSYKLNDFIIGGFYETSSNMEIQSTTVYLRSIKTIAGTTSDTNSIVVPSKFGLGFSYTNGRYIMGLDFISQDFTGLNYKKPESVSFGTNNVISIGGVRTGSKSINANIFDKVSYMFGLGFRQYYYNVLGNDINEYFASFGFSLPITKNTFFDTSIIIGSRGTIENSLVNEKFAKFNFNVSIGETWFKPYKFEYEE